MRRARRWLSNCGYPVSIHAPGRGATLSRVSATPWRVVSIHAPGRGATELCTCTSSTSKVSIHAPGRGATLAKLTKIVLDVLRFNSRTREGCDYHHSKYHHLMAKFQFTHPGGVRPALPSGQDWFHPVSIHAPGRGATSYYPFHSKSAQFQFTHPGGVRLIPCAFGLVRPTFQFTHPGGVRLKMGVLAWELL